MANARGKSIDNTHLSIDQAEKRGFIHRDYIAHCLRWTHVCKFMLQKGRYKTATVLDVGCGKDIPLIRMMNTSRMSPKEYYGIEYNKSPSEMALKHFENTTFKPELYFDIDFVERVEVHKKFLEINGTKKSLPSVITCFEVIEHVEPAHARAMVDRMANIAAASERAGKECNVFISTPNWDPQVGAADNHVNEMKHDAIGALLESVNFKVVEVYGTFASQKDLKPVLSDEEKALFGCLGEYYDSNYLATIFAPLYPAQSRNCLWHLRIRDEVEDRGMIFPEMQEVEEPWTSSEKWQELA